MLPVLGLKALVYALIFYIIQMPSILFRTNNAHTNIYIFRVFHKRVGAKHLAVLLLVLQTSGFEPEKGNAILLNTNIVTAP